MTTFRFPFFFAAGFAAILSGACVHTPPGTSVNLALARRPELVRLPATPAPAPSLALVKKTAAPGAESVAPDKTELVADAYSRGEFCMKAGRNDEAISAFREAVKVDSNFTEAWNNLAILYENGGQQELAMEAFRKAKKIASK